MTVQLVETSEDDSNLAVARHVGSLLDGKSEFKTSLAATPGNDLVTQAQQYIAQQQYGQFARLLMPHVELILAQGGEKALLDANTECCLNVLCHAVARIEPPSAAVHAATDLVDALAASTSLRPTCRLQAMLEMFSTAKVPEAQQAVLVGLLKYAKAAKLPALAVSLVGKAELWQRQWQLSTVEASDIFVAAADVLAMHARPALQREAFALRTKVLLACPAGDKTAIARLRDTAASACLHFIASPALFSCDLYRSPAVAVLESDDEFKSAYELLGIMLEGDLPAFKRDPSRFEGALQQASMSADDCVDKIRLMALLALATEREGAELSLTEMERVLELGPGDAEVWVVRAFGKQLLYGRIDQVKQVVHVRSCERRVFGDQDWRKLQADLSCWRENLASIEVTLHDHSLLTATSTVQPFLSS